MNSHSYVAIDIMSPKILEDMTYFMIIIVQYLVN